VGPFAELSTGSKRSFVTFPTVVRCPIRAAGGHASKVSPAMPLANLPLSAVVRATVVPNPDPKAPPGVSEQMSSVLAYVKWGVLVVIIIAAFVGVGAIAGGRVFSHHGASKVGVSMLVSSVVAAILYVGIYSFVTSITG
jgi:hypothetical protein